MHCCHHREIKNANQVREVAHGKGIGRELRYRRDGSSFIWVGSHAEVLTRSLKQERCHSFQLLNMPRSQCQIFHKLHTERVEVLGIIQLENAHAHIGVDTHAHERFARPVCLRKCSSCTS